MYTLSSSSPFNISFSDRDVVFPSIRYVDNLTMITPAMWQASSWQRLEQCVPVVAGMFLDQTGSSANDRIVS